MREEKANTFFSEKWMNKFPEKRKRKSAMEIYAKDYWGAHYVWRIFQQKISKKREQEARRLELNRVNSIEKHKNNFFSVIRK